MSRGRIGWKRLNAWMVEARQHIYLYSVCSCTQKSGAPGPHHHAGCLCYATARVKLVKCTGVWEERQATSRGHYRKIVVGPLKFVIEGLEPTKEPA